MSQYRKDGHLECCALPNRQAGRERLTIFLSASRLSQKVSQGRVLISYLVDLAIQGLVMDSVAAHAGILVGAGDTRLVQIFDDADYDEGLRRAFKQEADISSSGSRQTRRDAASKKRCARVEVDHQLPPTTARPGSSQ